MVKPRYQPCASYMYMYDCVYCAKDALDTAYRIRSIRRYSRIVAAPPEVLNEIVAALE